jgi:hypothetical protein
VRRDCDPHRGRLLAGLGTAGFHLALGALGFALVGLPAAVGGRADILRALAAPGFVLVSFPVAVGVWYIASGDLGRMGAGLMDAAGRRLTGQARWDGIAAAALSIFALCAWFLLHLAFPPW